ncbi:UbiA prenyltransferase [Mycena chlorophos]|uniref:UbiA prenyltransferase n=1 Tax=Mycena chlorophos TaxID=658473 RepID=A0A8H6TBW7_MYCCL|nr:UbiA prenyltransferase [Mycena chlorophos]
MSSQKPLEPALPLIMVQENEKMLGLPYVVEAVAHEIRVFWGFTKRDWSASMIPGLMYTIAALRSLDSTPSAEFVARALGRSLLYFMLYIYNFDIANQIIGVAEDRINKPDRPLASGLVSMQGAYIRWYLTTILHLHWTTKNLLFMSTGSLVLLQSAWGIVAPIPIRQTRWAFLLSGVFGIVASIQDMRDVDGDKATGRQTLPIVLGAYFRWTMAALVCVVPVICWQVDFLRYSQRYCGVLLTLAMLYMALRVLRGSSSQYDHKTYMILTYIYCGCVAVPMLVP